MKLDRTDFDLLAALQANGQMSNKDLAHANDISPSTCLERVRRLRAAGVIAGVHAYVQPIALGIQVQALISVRLRQHAHVQFDALLQEMKQMREVVNVYLLAGEQDLLVHVAVRDVPHLRSVVVDSFTSRDDVEQVETSLIFEYDRSAEWPNYQLEPTDDYARQRIDGPATDRRPGMEWEHGDGPIRPIPLLRCR